MPTFPPLLLASASPRRAELLRQLGVPFAIAIPEVEEAAPAVGVAPAALAVLNARRKAEAVGTAAPGQIILAADTVVVLDDRLLGKPDDATPAQEMLRQLSARTHSVITGFCLRAGDRERTAHVETRVTLAALSDDLIRAYLDTGEPLDKAGAYGIQGYAASFVERIEGDYTNVVGLPLQRLAVMLREFGIEVHRYWTPAR